MVTVPFMESVLCALLFTKNSTYTLLNNEFLKQSLDVVIMIVIPTLQRRHSVSEELSPRHRAGPSFHGRHTNGSISTLRAVCLQSPSLHPLSCSNGLLAVAKDTLSNLKRWICLPPPPYEFLRSIPGQATGTRLIHTLCRTWYMLCVRMSLMDSTSSGESLLVSCILWALETSLEGSQALFFHLGKGTTKAWIYFQEF